MRHFEAFFLARDSLAKFYRKLSPTDRREDAKEDAKQCIKCAAVK